jgi:hypothetical protein
LAKTAGVKISHRGIKIDRVQYIGKAYAQVQVVGFPLGTSTAKTTSSSAAYAAYAAYAAASTPAAAAAAATSASSSTAAAATASTGCRTGIFDVSKSEILPYAEIYG